MSWNTSPLGRDDHEYRMVPIADVGTVDLNTVGVARGLPTASVWVKGPAVSESRSGRTWKEIVVVTICPLALDPMNMYEVRDTVVGDVPWNRN
jgi:hypothetical protein